MSRRRARPVGQDEGFSLVEAVVALALATVIFTALAAALIGGLKSAVLSQQNQQAGDVLNQAVEQARAVPYDALTLRAADLDTGERPRTPTLSGCLCYAPATDTTSGAGVEALVAPDPNGLPAHVTTKSQNGTTFTVRRYVTVPTDAAGAVYKRLTVVVDWTTLGKSRTRTYSTLVAATERGLPLPDFKFTNASSPGSCRNPASEAVYAFTLRNNGARDAWSLTHTVTSPSWAYYADTNANGGYDGGDAALPGSPTSPTTGLLEPTTARTFFAVLQLPTAAVRPPDYTIATTFRATSVAQPSAWQELTTVTTVQAGPCGSTSTTAAPTATPSTTPTGTPPVAPAQPSPSCPSLTGSVGTSAPGGTMVRYHPVNPDQPSNTTARLGMPVRRDAGTPLAAMSLYNLSTDLHAVAGRALASGTSGTVTDTASWSYTMPAFSQLKGGGEVTVWARPSTAPLTDQPAFRVTLEHLWPTGALKAVVDEQTFLAPSAGWGCEGFRPFSVPLVDTHGNGRAIEANERLRLTVRVTNGVPVQLAYGTAAYPMTMTLPYKSGLG